MTELLDDAIRAGLKRGMDEAPVVPDLAQRVRALPTPQRHWKLPVAAAAAVVALVSLGVAAYIPHATSTGPLVLPNSSGATTGGPQTAERALGTWTAVWNAGYDGPAMGSVTVAPSDNDQTGYQVTLAAGCPDIGAGGHLSATGRLLDRSIRPRGIATCAARARWYPPDSFETAFETFDHLVVSTDGRALTLLAGQTPLAQLAPLKAADASAWSESGQLPAAAQGTWQYIGGPTDGRVAPVATMTLSPGGQVKGSGGCNNFIARYSIGVDGRATFSPFTLHNHSCPAGTSPTWQPPADLARVGVSNGRLTMYDAGFQVLAAFDRVATAAPADLLGSWQVVGDASQQLGGLVEVQFLSNGSYSGTDGCDSLFGHYAVDSDGRMTITGAGMTAKYCVNHPLNRGRITDLHRISVRGDVLTAYGADGTQLATFNRVASTPTDSHR